MTLPPVFRFSQHSLQDYVDCARRFQLRYVLGQRWPAPQVEPIREQEVFIEQGLRFHRLVHRHLIGLPEESLVPSDPLLAEWWENYLRFPPPELPEAVRLPEAMLGAPLAGHWLTARYDLLAIAPGERAVIVDWKTGRFRPRRQSLAERLQTRVYLYLMVEAGEHLFGGPLQAEQVSMIYWFADYPTEPEIFVYSTAQHEDNRAYLTGLIEDILSLDKGLKPLASDEVWPLTEEERRCQYCIYRSLCDRGVRAGTLEEDGLDVAEMEERFDFEFDLDDVEEIAF
jgi:CRISPR/Cas system-associated exonuclease Cas4 (RecB family)